MAESGDARRIFGPNDARDMHEAMGGSLTETAASLVAGGMLLAV
jgi:hypothetical protein